MKKGHEWGEVIPPSEVVDPIIFHFRPNKILSIAPEHRADFEKFFEENVGFPPPPVPASGSMEMRAAYPNGGISGSNDGWDD
ncbi:MAG: hypothetical protein ACRDJC_22215 [Thermomicrobiales bacterium]